MNEFSLQWHITQKCNNNCKHCYMDDTNQELSYDKYLHCINNINEFEEKYDLNIAHIAISGGDPLLHSRWFDIASDLVLRNKKLTFLGNP